MIKGYTAEQNAAKARARAAASRTITAKTKQRGRPRKASEPLPPPNPMPSAQPQAVGFPILIPDQLRTCLMAKDDVEAAVRATVKEVIEKMEEKYTGARKVYLDEAMKRLHVKSRSTLWHWDERGYMFQDHDENGHVYYPEAKIRRAERGEQPELPGAVRPPKYEPKKRNDDGK